jgi:hypothetical protein
MQKFSAIFCRAYKKGLYSLKNSTEKKESPENKEK